MIAESVRSIRRRGMRSGSANEIDVKEFHGRLVGNLHRFKFLVVIEFSLNVLND